jgi:hypothetical protein
MAEATKLERKTKIALDETRLLILGAQILLGFQFIATFQDLFADLSPPVRDLHAAAQFLMVACIGFLIAPAASRPFPPAKPSGRRGDRPSPGNGFFSLRV